MTIETTVNKVQYAGNGVTVAFDFLNVFFAASDLVVTLYDTTAMAAVSPAPVLNGLATYDYIVTGTFDTATGEYTAGGTVTFNNAPPSNYRITIERVVPPTQDVALIDNSKFPANTVNGAFDRLTVIAQRALQLVAQALTYPSSDPSTVSSVLPNSQTRASMFLAFDSSGNPVASPGPSATGQPISAFWATTIQLATAALSRAALAVAGLADNNAFTGTNTVPTQAAGDSSTKIASTAFNPVAVPVVATLATNTDLSTTIPADDTIPQIGEGTQIFSQAFTAAVAAHRIRVRVSGFGATKTASDLITVALFIDGGANAVAATGVRTSAADFVAPILLEYEAAQTAGAHTYTARVGADTQVVRLNGNSSTRIYGGVAAVKLTIEEIRAP